MPETNNMQYFGDNADLFNSGASVLAVPVSCDGVMKDALGTQFKEQYPDMYSWYTGHCEAGNFQPGHTYFYTDTSHILESGNPTFIALMAVKEHAQDAANMEYIDSALKELAGFDTDSVALPKMENQADGLSWNAVNTAIKRADFKANNVLVFGDDVPAPKETDAQAAEQQTTAQQPVQTESVPLPANINGVHKPYLSPMYDADITLNIAGSLYTFHNAEAAYQAVKQPHSANRFTSLSASAARRLGNDVSQIQPTDSFEGTKIAVMYTVMNAEFQQNSELMEMLQAEDDANLDAAYRDRDAVWSTDTDGNGSRYFARILRKIKSDNSGGQYDDPELDAEVSKPTAVTTSRNPMMVSNAEASNYYKQSINMPNVSGTKSVLFVGREPDSLHFSQPRHGFESRSYSAVRNQMIEMMHNLAEQGVETIITSGDAGMSTVAADAVDKCNQKYGTQLKNDIYLPNKDYVDTVFSRSNVDYMSTRTNDRLKAKAAHVIDTSYGQGSPDSVFSNERRQEAAWNEQMKNRRQAMVNNADLVISIDAKADNSYTGRTDEEAAVLRQADRAGKPILSLDYANTGRGLVLKGIYAANHSGENPEKYLHSAAVTRRNDISHQQTAVADRLQRNEPIHYSDVASPDDGRTMSKYMAEFVFAGVISDINHLRNSNPERPNAHDPDNPHNLILTSEARKIHDLYIDRLEHGWHYTDGSFHKPIDYKADDMQEGLAQMADAIHSLLPRSDIESLTENISSNAALFEKLSGMKCEMDDGSFAPRPLNEDERRLACVPLSPYDSKYAMKSTFLNYGGQILFESLADLSRGTTLGAKLSTYRSDTPEDDFRTENLNPLKEMENPMLGMGTGRRLAGTDNWNDTMTLDEQADQLGIAYLMQYFPDDERRSILDGMKDSRPVPPEMQQKAVNIMDYLRSHGYNCTVDRIRGTGFDVKIEETPYTVTLLDTSYRYTGRDRKPDLETYHYDNVGSVYSTALQRRINLHMDMSTKDKNNTKIGLPYLGSDIEESELVPLKYVMGETISWGNEPVEYQDNSTKLNKINNESLPSGNKQAIASEFANRDSEYNISLSQHAFVQDGVKVYPKLAIASRDKSIDASRAETFRTLTKEIGTGESYIAACAESARSNFIERTGLDSLLAAVHDYNEAKGIEAANAGSTEESKAELNFTFSDDQIISDLQHSYVDFLTGRRDSLVRPDKDESEYKDKINEILTSARHSNADGINKAKEDVNALNSEYLMNVYDYDSPEDAVVAHFTDYLNEKIGRLERDETGQFIRGTDGKLFSPDMVKRYETITAGIGSVWERNDRFAEAIGQADISADDLRGRDYANNRLIDSSIKFGYGCRGNADLTSPDINRLSDMAEKSNVMRTALQAVQQAVKSSPTAFFDPDDPNGRDSILIDKNGVIQYTVYRPVGMYYGFSNSYKKAHPNEKFSGLKGMIREYRDADPEQRAALKDKYSGHVRIEKNVCQIGQVFDYDNAELTDSAGNSYRPPVVKTDFKSGTNYAFIPLKTGYVTPKYVNGHVDVRSTADRLWIKTYETQLSSAIRMQVKEDMMSANRNITRDENGDANVGSGSSINSMYHHMYDVKLPYNYIESNREFGNDDDYLITKLKNMSSMVKLATAIKNDTSLQTATDYAAKDIERGIGNNNRRSYYDDMGCKNRTVIQADFNGYFDPVITGTARNQGMLLLLADRASVDPKTSHINPARKPDGSIDTEARAEFANTGFGKYMHNCPADRQIMVFNEFKDSLSIKHHVGYMQLSTGWTYDDGYVISKRYAESVKVPDKDHPGEFRHMMIGDKIVDNSANKGTIAMIVDPDMSDEEAKRLHIEKLVQLYRDNPNLDIVGSPYPHVSRINGATARKAMEDTWDAKVNGEIKKGCGGYIDVLNLKQTVDAKTNLYEDDGEGRNASAQLAWALEGLGMNHVMHELYGDNTPAVAEMRNYVNVLGYDIDPYSTVHAGLGMQFADGAAERHIIKAPDFSQKGPDIERANVRSRMLAEMQDYGGFAEVPFKLSFAGKDKDGNNLTIPNVYASCLENPNGWLAKKYFTNGLDAATTEELDKAKNTYLLPLIDPKYRAGTDMGDDISYHEFTRTYSRIVMQAYAYNASLKNEAEGYQPTKKTSEPVKEAEKKWKNKLLVDRKKAQEKAQSALNELSGKIKSCYFDLKDNFISTDIMKNPVRNSATAVITNNPTINIDEVKMGPALAKALNIAHYDEEKGKVVLNHEKEHVLIWRDPILNKDGVRCMNVVLDTNQNLTGIQINGIVDSGFGADFDGDTMAVVSLHDKAAVDEAVKKLMPRPNLQLNITAQKVDMPVVQLCHDENGNLGFEFAQNKDGTPKMMKGYPLVYNDGMDLAAGEAVKPELHMHRVVLDSLVNQSAMAYRIHPQTEESTAAYLKRMDKLLDAYSRYAKEAFDVGFGKHVISYNSMKEHLQSIADYMNDGAKAGGKVDKLLTYAEACGVEITDKDGNVISAKNNNLDKLMDPNTKQIHVEACQVIGHPETLGDVPAAVMNSFDITGRTTELERESEYANAVKTYDVSGAGYISKKAVAVTRNFGDVKMDDQTQSSMLALAIGVTEPNTQSIMKIRQDPMEASKKDTYINNLVPKLFDGSAIHKVDGNGNEIPLDKVSETPGTWEVQTQFIAVDKDVPYDKKAAVYKELPRKTTPAEWEKAASAFFNDADGLNVSVNPQAVHMLAQAIGSDNSGRMGKVTNMQKVDLLDRMLVYHSSNGGIIETLKQAAANGASMFNDPSSPGSYAFCPTKIRENIAVKEGLKEGEVRDIVSSGCVEHAPRYKSESAVDMKKPLTKLQKFAEAEKRKAESWKQKLNEQHSRRTVKVA